MCALSLGLLLQLGVGLDTADELLTGAGQGDVLNAEVDTLLDITVLDLLVDNDTDGALGDIVDDTSLSVVDLVWHTTQGQHFCFARHDHPSQCIPQKSQCHSPLLDGTVGLDVDDISNLVLSQVGRQLDHTLCRALAPHRNISSVRRIVDSHLLLEVTAERIARAGSETRWMTHLDLLIEECVEGWCCRRDCRWVMVLTILPSSRNCIGFWNPNLLCGFWR